MKTAVALLIVSTNVPATIGKTVIGFGRDGGAASVDLNVGSTMMVNLETNPSTGYDWELEGDLPSCLFMKSSETRSISKHEGSLVGAPSIKEVVFKATEACKADLKFVYIRSWLAEPVPEKRATVHVTVSEEEL